jgi:hypothetical protein
MRATARRRQAARDGYQRNYNTVYRRRRSIVKAGVLGDVFMARYSPVSQQQLAPHRRSSGGELRPVESGATDVGPPLNGGSAKCSRACSPSSPATR